MRDQMRFHPAWSLLGGTLLATPVVGPHTRRVAKPMHIQFPSYDPIPILFEDRSVIAIDKPAGWMLIPYTWQRTNRNLQAAIDSSIGSGAYWAKSRNVKQLQHVHRLDAETTGILLFARNSGAHRGIASLFEQREMEKVYLAVVEGRPKQQAWTCDKPIGPAPHEFGRMQVDMKEGKPAETAFKVLSEQEGRTLIECRPVTGRTHQIRIHLLAAGLSLVGDPLYNRVRLTSPSRLFPMGLRAVKLSFRSPFTGKKIFIKAEREVFLAAYGFGSLSTAPTDAAPETLQDQATHPTERAGAEVKTGTKKPIRRPMPTTGARKPQQSRRSK